MTQGTATLIKIGDSVGITLPAKDLKKSGLKVGSSITFSYEPVVQDAEKELMKDYEAFKKQYGETLKNLASR